MAWLYRTAINVASDWLHSRRLAIPVIGTDKEMRFLITGDGIGPYAYAAVMLRSVVATRSADWVVLSACNTIAGDKPGAEALSGLARAPA